MNEFNQTPFPIIAKSYANNYGSFPPISPCLDAVAFDVYLFSPLVDHDEYGMCRVAATVDGPGRETINK